MAAKKTAYAFLNINLFDAFFYAWSAVKNVICYKKKKVSALSKLLRKYKEKKLVFPQTHPEEFDNLVSQGNGLVFCAELTHADIAAAVIQKKKRVMKRMEETSVK